MSSGFGAGQAPVAVSRNWKAYGMTALAGVAGLGAFVWFVVSGADDGHEPTARLGDVGVSAASFPERKFVAEKKPAPQPPPAPPPAILPPVAMIAQAEKHVPPPPPPAAMASMFAMGSDQEAAQFYVQISGGAGAPVVGTNTQVRPGSSDGVDRLDADQRQGLSAQKNRWLSEAGGGGSDYVLTPKMPPIGRFMLQAGTIIQATTLNEINSDLPGDVVALINTDVLDTPTGRVVLIPAASKLYGRYNDQLSYGQRRAQIGWTRILFPDGSSQNIGSMAGTDASGAAGIEGDVDRHPWDMALAIGGTAFFSVLSQTGQIVNGGSGETTIIGAGASGAGGAAASIGQQIISRELNRPNTLIVPQGSSVAVMLSKDMALPPYQAATR